MSFRVLSLKNGKSTILGILRKYEFTSKWWRVEVPGCTKLRGMEAATLEEGLAILINRNVNGL